MSLPSDSQPQHFKGQHHGLLDRVLIEIDTALRHLSMPGAASRPSPANAYPEPPPLSETDRRKAGALMRVNHVGEVCAQALYRGQALSTANAHTRRAFHAAAEEETDHLGWTYERLQALKARPSLLNPLWYVGAFALGALAGLRGDAYSYGFMAETEKQVEQHLGGHLSSLPIDDVASRAVVAQMQADEALHRYQAELAGGLPLPGWVCGLMRLGARVMTRTAHYL